MSNFSIWRSEVRSENSPDLQMTIKSDKPAPAKVGPGRAEQCALSGYYIAFSILLLRAEISGLDISIVCQDLHI